MTTKQFYRWLKVRHSDTYGPARLESTKRLLQSNDLLPKYSQRIEGEDVALFITTALLAPTFRFSSDGASFLKIIKSLTQAQEGNIYSLLKLILTDYSVLLTVDELVIDLSTGNTLVRFVEGKKQYLLTKDLDLNKPGLRSFAILSKKHLKEIFIRLQQNEAEGAQISKKELEKILN